MPPPPKSMGTNLSFSLMEQGLLAMSSSLGFSKIDTDTVDRQREKMIEKMPLVHKDPETGEDTWEKLLVFFEDTEEVRAEPELGGLGPGLTGEYTLYSFVVGWCPSKKSVSAAKKWKMKMRFSQFYAFDQHLQQYLRQLGIDETRLPEFPEKVYFGHMSPSLVKERKAALEFYFQELVKDKELTREPIVRAFLKLPMSTEDVQALESEVSQLPYLPDHLLATVLLTYNRRLVLGLWRRIDGRDGRVQVSPANNSRGESQGKAPHAKEGNFCRRTHARRRRRGRDGIRKIIG